ncbi:hypothetical protein BH09PAT3_BH09PAT3_5620 [soil metagenome]
MHNYSKSTAYTRYPLLTGVYHSGRLDMYGLQDFVGFLI